MMKNRITRILALLGFMIALLTSGTAQGAITAQADITPATAWPETVAISTGDPALHTGAIQVTSAHILSQTITPTSNMTLGTLYFTYSTAAASAANSFSIRIQQVAGGSAVQTYTQGTNLLPSSAFTFTLPSTGGAIRILKFTFSGTDQISLAAGSTYAVEVASTASTLSLYRRGADTYAGGALYDNRSAFNYPSTRDVAIAVVAATGGVPDTQAPSVPTGLSATAVSSSQINLSWTASTDNVGVAGYKIFRNGTQIDTTAANSYSSTGLAASTSYSFTVSANDAAGNNSAQSAPASATTQSGGAGEVGLIEGLASGTAWPEAVFLETGAPGGSAGNAANGTTIISQTFTPATNTTLGAIYMSYSTAAASTANAFTLRIQQVSGGSGVQTYTQGTNLLGAAPVTFDLDSTAGVLKTLKFEFGGSYQIPLIAGTTYAVEISSTGSAVLVYRRGASTYAGGAFYTNRSAFNYPSTRDLSMAIVSSPGTGGSDTQAPTVPAGLTATAVSSSQINLSWTASTDNVGVAGYKIYRGGTQIATTAGTSYSNTGLTASTAYSYTVAAYDVAANTSAQSGSASATTQAGGGGQPLKIMPLGDSITDGYLIPGAYRINLEPQLQGAGIAFDFVGAMSNGPATLNDKNHEGHSGKRIDEIMALINQWGYITTFQPDVVLLMAGTNDVIQNYQFATAPQRLMALIDRIHELRPNTTVIVANLVTIGPSYLDRLNQFNAAIAPLIQAKIANGEKVLFVDQNTGSLWAETYDGVHPNAAGYVKISNNWFNAIQTYLGN